MPNCIDCNKKLGRRKAKRCQQCAGKARAGENREYWNFPKSHEHHNWKGGITPLHSLIRKLKIYKKWRISVLKRDDYTCQNCNHRGGWLEVHHINLFSDILRENRIINIKTATKCHQLWDLSNGITLCKQCHHKK